MLPNIAPDAVNWKPGGSKLGLTKISSTVNSTLPAPGGLKRHAKEFYVLAALERAWGVIHAVGQNPRTGVEYRRIRGDTDIDLDG
jgi:hypothetical protein